MGLSAEGIMELLFRSDAFQTYAMCSAILALKMWGSAVYTALQRRGSSGFVNAEDAKLLAPDAAASEVEKPEVAHALRIQRNDLENIPLFWIVGMLYVFTGATALGAAAYCWTFTIARVLHTVVYVRQMQPARALMWLIGSLAVIGMAVQVIWRTI